MQRPKLGRAILAGIIAWVVFVIALHVFPILGAPELDLPAMLGGLFGWNSSAVGWVILFVAGIAFALLYAYWWVAHLPGPAWQRGLVYGIVPWLVMMVVVVPLLPALSPSMNPRAAPGVFLVNLGAIALFEGLIVFLIWGAVLGILYGNVAETRVSLASAAVAVLPFLVFAILVVTQKRYSPIVIEQNMSSVTTYDPDRAMEPPALPVVYNVYDRLVAPDGGDPTHVVPSLAQSWIVSKDGLDYTFELRHGIFFPSGVQLSADDVMWSFRRLKHLNGPPSHLADVIADVRAVEHYIVRIRLTRPSPDFLSVLTAPQFSVLDGRTVLDHGGTATADAATNDTATEWLNAHSAGTGPWMLRRSTPHRETVLARNPDYWGESVYQGRVIFRGEKDAASGLRDLEAGRADVVLALSASETSAASQSDHIRLLGSGPLAVAIRDTVGGIRMVPPAILDLRTVSKD